MCGRTCAPLIPLPGCRFLGVALPLACQRWARKKRREGKKTVRRQKKLNRQKKPRPPSAAPRAKAFQLLRPPQNPPGPSKERALRAFPRKSGAYILD